MGIFFRSDTIFVPFLVHRAPKRKRGVVGAAPYSSIELLVKLQFIPRLIYNRHFLQKFTKNLRIHRVSRIAPRRKI